MILFTNGCSWTWGGNLEPWMKENNKINHEKRLQLVWPHHLGNILKADKVVNLAEGCGSNQRIVRTTFDWLVEQSESTLADTIAVIQITSTSRFELYEPITIEPFENIRRQWIKCKWDMVRGDFDNTTKYDEDFVLQKAKRRVAETHDIEDLYRNIGYLYALQSMFISFKIKRWYFWNMGGIHNWIREFTEDKFDSFSCHFPIIDTDDEWVYERVNKEELHPSLTGHQQLAQIIYQAIAKK